MSPLTAADYERLADAALAAVHQAAGAILAVYAEAAPVAQSKADQSPLTRADLLAHDILTRELAALPPHLPVLSEEGQDHDGESRRRWNRCWIIDPLDGTREFLAKNGEFTVNVALIEDHRPTLGIVGTPVAQQASLGIVPRQRAETIDFRTGSRRPIACRPCPAQPVIMASRNHRSPPLEALLAHLRYTFPDAREQQVGSALKLVQMAQGQCDGYPRCSPTSEWDIAAGEAVLMAAGGCVRQFDGAPLRYNKPDTLLNPWFWAAGDPQGALAHWFETCPPPST